MSETPEMVERVARAMERARNPQWTDEEFDVWWEQDPFFCDRVTSWGYFTGTRKQRCIIEARAAIEAMREISIAEKAPGVSAYVKAAGQCRPVALGAAWQAIIDAALTTSSTA